MKLLEKIDLDSLIDQNIHLIDTGKFEEFYDVCKAQLKRKDLILLTDLLAEEGIELPYQITGFMYGIKTKDAILSLRAPISTTQYGVGFTQSIYMKGGHQIGFESRKAAQDYADTLPNYTRISIILPETIAGYNWKQIEIPGGTAFATTSAINSFKPYMDPDQRKISRLKTKYTNEINKLEKEITEPEKAEDIRKLTADKNTAIAEDILEKLKKYVEDFPKEYFKNPDYVNTQLSYRGIIDTPLHCCKSVWRDDIDISLYIDFIDENSAKNFESGLKKVFSDNKQQIVSMKLLAETHYKITIATPYIIDSTSPEALDVIDKKTKKLELLKQKLAAI